jgi:lia operon protein LiaG
MRWMKKRKGLASMLFVAVLAGAGPSAGQEVHRVAGQDVAIYNLVGRVQVVRGTGADVVVRVTRGGADASRLTIETAPTRGRPSLTVRYPDGDIVYPAMGRGSSSTITVREDGTFGSSGRGQVRIRGRGDGLEAWADLVIEVPAGRTVSAFLGVGDLSASGVRGDLRLESRSGGVTATDVSGSLVIDAGSGGVSVRRVEGTLRVDTGSGAVEVTAVTGPEVVLDAGSGSVRVTGVETSRLNVDTGSGSVALSGVRAPVVVVDTGSGSVDIELLADVDRLDVETGSGSVTVRAPEGLGGMVELDTGSGGIDLDFPLEVTSVRRDRVAGRLGDGQGRIRIDTGSGGIRLLRGPRSSNRRPRRRERLTTKS